MTNNNIQLPKLFDGEALGLVDRDREVKQLMYALFTREHMLLMGLPGTAKSQFATNVFGAIDGANTFEIHLTKQTTEEYVFGPINIEELKKGNVIHNTKDSILDADFAFIDEFFDASDVLLRSLLGVLNERRWIKGSQKMDAKLHSAILTSNYQRESEITQAILDRIIFKTEVQPVTAKTKRKQIYKNFLANGNFQPTKVFDFKKLQEFSKIVDDPNSIKFPNEVLDAYDVLLEQYQKETKKYVSQRTANKALKVLKVASLLDNRDSVEYKDLEELKFVLCTLNVKMEEELFDAVYEKHIGKIEEEKTALQELEGVEARIKEIPSDFSGLSDQEFISKMREINEYVHGLEAMQTPTRAINEKRGEILSNLRNTIEKNRDKLFTRNKGKGVAKDDKTEAVEAEYIEEN